MFAQSGSAGDNPFDAYERAVDNQLSAMLEHDQSAVQEPVVERTSIVQETMINGNRKEAGMGAFAKRSWRGREDQLVPALNRLQRLRPTLEPILESEGVPKQFVAAALIESDAQPMALSSRQTRALTIRSIDCSPIRALGKPGEG